MEEDAKKEIFSTINNEVERRIAEYSRNDADKHRLFLESMFKRITWAIGIILIIVLGAGAFLFGKSVQSASKIAVENFLSEENVQSEIKEEINATLRSSAPQIQQSARTEVKRALKKETGLALENEIQKKIEVIKSLTKTDLIQSGLRGKPGKQGLPGPPGPIGPRGARGGEGPPGRDGAAWVPQLTVFETKSFRQPSSKNMGNHSVCFIASSGEIHHNQSCRCGVVPMGGNGKPSWTFKVELDPSVNGACFCGIACLD